MKQAFVVRSLLHTEMKMIIQHIDETCIQYERLIFSSWVESMAVSHRELHREVHDGVIPLMTRMLSLPDVNVLGVRCATAAVLKLKIGTSALAFMGKTS